MNKFTRSMIYVFIFITIIGMFSNALLEVYIYDLLIKYGTYAIVFAIIIIVGITKENSDKKAAMNRFKKYVKDDFYNLYEKITETRIYNELEHIRIYIKSHIRLNYTKIILGIILYIIALVIYKKAKFWGTIVFLSSILLMFLGDKGLKRIKNSTAIDEYKDKYKKEVITNFINLLDNRLMYKDKVESNEEKINIKVEYKKAGFYIRSGSLLIEDYLEGKLSEEDHIKMCDLKELFENSEGNVQTRYQGIFSFINFRGNINNNIRIKTGAQRILSGLMNEGFVETDNDEFNKCFAVYSNDKILTIRILTADVMEYLIDFYKKYNVNFEMNLKEDKIYLRFWINNMFEPNVFENSMDITPLIIYYTTINFILELTKRMNKTLNNIEI